MFLKSELEKMSREEFIAVIQAEYESFKAINELQLVDLQFQGLNKTGFLRSDKEFLLLNTIEAFVKIENPDTGAYCGGMSIEVKRKNTFFLYAEPIAQGNLTNELYFDLIHEIFTDREFHVNLGNMI